MQVIYAHGQPGNLDFAVTERREDVPEAAIVFAVCTAGRTIENLDEDLLEAITAEEIDTLRSLVSEAAKRERQQQLQPQSMMTLPMDKFLAWLLGRAARPSMPVTRVAPA